MTTWSPKFKFYRIFRIVPVLLLFALIVPGSTWGFTTNDTSISRTFDKNLAIGADDIVITVTFQNAEASTLKGFYYVEYVPNELTVKTRSVKIDGIEVSNYVTESGTPGAVYTGRTEYKWVLETPTTFAQNNPVNPSSTVDLVYSIGASQSGIYSFDEFCWVGYYPSATRGAFGHSEPVDRATVEFQSYIFGGSTDGGGGGGCFIATAAYGSYEASYVKILRRFRDEYLLNNAPGSWFVTQYYKYSPPAADWIRNRKGVRWVVRLLLYPLVVFSWLLLEAGSIIKMFVVLLPFLMSLVLSSIFRRKRERVGGGSC